MKVGERIREFRKAKGFTQDELASKLGISQQMIAQYENSRRTPKVESLKKIATALDVSVLSLLGFSLEDIPTDELLIEIKRRCLK